MPTSSKNLRCGRIKYLFKNEARIRRVSVINTQNQNKEKKPSKQTEYIIGSIIGIACLIIFTIIAIKKFKASTPINSRSQSLNSSTVEEIEMDEMGPYK